MSKERSFLDCKYLTCYSLVGIVLLVIGILVLVSKHGGGCPCNSEHCCEQDERCSDDTPCFCVNADTDSTNSTCLATEDKHKEHTELAAVMLALGITMIFIFTVVPLGFAVYSMSRVSDSL